MRDFLLSRGGICDEDRYMRALVFSIIVAFSLGGCASIELARRENTQNLLSAAGFEIIPANSPERQSSLLALIPFTIVRNLNGDEVRYAYADPEQNILYSGNQEAYAKYQQFRLQQQIANANIQAAQLNMNAAHQWNDWACWGPPVMIPQLQKFPNH